HSHPSSHTLSLDVHTPHPQLHSFPTRRSSDLSMRLTRCHSPHQIPTDSGPSSCARDSAAPPPRPEETWRRSRPTAHDEGPESVGDRKSTRLNSSHVAISYAVFCLKKKKRNKKP